MTVIVKLRGLLRRVEALRYGVNRYRHFKAARRFRAQFANFRRLATAAGSPQRFPLDWVNRLPCYGDDTGHTSFDRHYIYHTAWAARVVRDVAPPVHVDISSTLYFCGILSAFVPVKFYDYRPADLRLSDLSSAAADLCGLPFADDTIGCLSCMHVVEHVGLGRYGDPLDPAGDLKAARELERVVARGGSLLFVVPVGRPAVRFNAHRIYSFNQVLEMFPKLRLREFTLIPGDEEKGGLIKDITGTSVADEDYGCGCFWFTKPD